AVIDVSGIIDDANLEGDEVVAVTLRSVSADPDITLDTNAAHLTATVTILDNDSATVSITANDATASETATNNGQFTVSLTKVSSTDTVVGYVLTGSTSTPTDDYTALSRSFPTRRSTDLAVIDVSGIIDD